MASRFDLTQTGAVEVMAIEPGGPADQAGILEDDLIVVARRAADDERGRSAQAADAIAGRRAGADCAAARRSPAESPGVADGLSDASVQISPVRGGTKLSLRTTRMSEVAEIYDLDLLHVHYAIPHSVSAFLAREMTAFGPGENAICHSSRPCMERT